MLNDEGAYIGFDAIIGNPPYFSVSGEKYFKNEYFSKTFKTFTSSTDIYALFYELAIKTLRNKGLNSFIVSNKWMNASYGKNLRKFIIEKSNPLLIIDFDKTLIFSEATVFVNISLLEKSSNIDELQGCVIDKSKEVFNFEIYLNNNLIHLKGIDENVWKIIPTSIQDINEKLLQKGKLLKHWNNKIFRGITSGANGVLIIDSELRRKLGNAEIIKPVLRGRDIKRYKYVFGGEYIINTYNGRIQNGKRVDRIEAKDYPLVYDYLMVNQTILEKRQDKGVHWMNLRNCAFEEKFSEEKIVWLEISDKANYAYDTENMYLTNSAYFLTGKNLKYLLALLNSKLIDFYFFQITAQIAGGRKRYTKQYVEQVPIIEIEKTAQKPFEDRVNLILKLKEENPKADTSSLEKEIDQMVYKLYGLTEEEIAIVENS